LTVNFKRIGVRIKEGRRLRRMTQAELAERVGVSDSFISRMETGKKGVSLDSLIKVAVVLDISIDSFVLDDSQSRLPQGYREFWDLLADCDMGERAAILKTASAYKKVLREGQK